jgi:hypothetical protein
MLAAAAPASAKVGQPRTTGDSYDRNPSVVQDGPLTYLFFARSEEQPCNRLAGCDADNVDYDLYYKLSTDGGKTYGPATLAAINPDGPGPFRGRTIAAVRIGGAGADAGTLDVFWASGADADALYVVKKAPTANAFAPAMLVPGTHAPVFNVEALARGGTVYVYTEECCGMLTSGIYSYVYDGTSVAGGTVAAAPDRNLPKGIVDVNGTIRLTFVDSTHYPTVDVWVASSTDGLAFPDQHPIVHEVNVSNWDPNLAQLPNGRYYLHFAPDNGLGRQRIAVTTSNDFVNWSAPHEVTPGFTSGTPYWDYWPEGFVLGNKLTLYYTSERAIGAAEPGIGHVWSDPGFSGVDADNLAPNGSFESSATGIAPDAWTPAGDATYTSGGTDGARSVSAGALGTWTSAPIAVQPGATYVVGADVLGSGGTVSVEQLSATGAVVGALTRTVAGLPGGFFQTVDDTVTVDSGVSAVRIKIAGGLTGQSQFDDVRLWRQ